MNVLTERQTEVYNFIVDFFKQHGYTPTIGEIAKGMYLSKSSVHRYIITLYNKGYLTFTPKVTRSICINK